MATLFVTEYQLVEHNRWGFQAQVGVEPAEANQTVAIGGTSTQSSAFGADTKLVRVHTDTTCSIAFGASPTATSSTARLAANATEYFRVEPGHKVAVISNS